MDSKSRKAYIAKRKSDGVKFPQILREIHGRQAKADGGDVESIPRLRQKIAAYTSRGMELPPELLAAVNRLTSPEQQRAEEGAIATGAAEMTGVPSVIRGSENIVGGISEGDGLRAAKGAGEVVLGASPGLGALGRAGLGAARTIGNALYGSLPRLGATTAASIAPGVLDDAYAETKSDYARTGSVGAEPSIWDAAKRLAAGRDFTPVADEDFRRQYSTRNPLPQRQTEQDYVEQQVKSFRESPAYQVFVQNNAASRATAREQEIAKRAREDYRKSYGQIFENQLSDWDRQYQGERGNYLNTLNKERLDYQKKPFSERNPGINALTYAVPAAIAAQRYGAKIDRNAADARRLMRIAEDSAQPVTARIAAQKDLADVLKNTPQTGIGKTLDAAKYGAGGGALSVLMGTGQDLADTFYLDPDSEARKRASMKYVPIDDQGNTDFGPMKDMLKNNAQRLAIMSGAVGSVPLFKSGLSTAETAAANRVARGPDLFDMDAKRAALAKVQDIERRGISDRLEDAGQRRDLQRSADELDALAQQTDATALLGRDTQEILRRAQRAAVNGWKPSPKWIEEQRQKMLGLTTPANPPRQPAKTPNQPALPPPANMLANTTPAAPVDPDLSSKVSKFFDTQAREYAAAGVAPYKDKVAAAPDKYLRSAVALATGKKLADVTPDEIAAARTVFGNWAPGKADGGAVIDRAMRATHWQRQNRYARGGSVHRKGMFKRGMKDC